jgi:hypothetical protein
MRHAPPLYHRRSRHASLAIINRHGLPGHGKRAGGQPMHHAVATTVTGVLEPRLAEA